MAHSTQESRISHRFKCQDQGEVTRAATLQKRLNADHFQRSVICEKDMDPEQLNRDFDAERLTLRV